MLRNWRAWVLVVLLIGPILAYIGLGSLWLLQHTGPIGIKGELLYYGMTVWVTTGIAFAVLANRWTRTRHRVLPPLDWDAPETFTEQDREAWNIVQESATLADTLTGDSLVQFDTFLDISRGLAEKLARHYHPDSTAPLEQVPVVDLLTALQLAAEDLTSLCRQMPGGDLVTASHWKTAVAAVGWVSRANELYTYLLPIFQPVAGLARLGAQKLMVQPAWRDAQSNLLRWFFRAFVNRLGTHLIELFSGRLAMGADAYHRLKSKGRAAMPMDDTGPISIVLVGASGSGKSTAMLALDAARQGSLERVRTELMGFGHDPGLADRLRSAVLTELSGPRDAGSIPTVAARAGAADLLIYLLPANRADTPLMREFLDTWRTRVSMQPGRDASPVLIVLTRADLPELDEPWCPPVDWVHGQGPREVAVRATIARLRSELPPFVASIVPVALPPNAPAFGVVESLLAAIAMLLPRVERSSILRHYSGLASRSQARRLLGQVGKHGRRLWGHLSPPWSRGHAPTPSETVSKSS